VELIDLETMTGYAAEMQDIIYEGSLAHRKAFIRGFVKDICVTGEKAVPSYSPPDLSDKVELNLKGVPRIVQHGGPWGTVPELFFDKKQLILDLQQLLVSCQRPPA